MIKEFVRDKIILRNKLVGKFPHSINIELTNRCNLACLMCPHQFMGNFGDMDFELFKKVIDQCSEFADDKTTFSLVGLGEPLLYPRLMEAIEYIKTRYFTSRVNFATNGTLLDMGNALELSQLLGATDGLLISLNVNTWDEYEKLMGADRYDIVVDNIQSFLKLRDRKVPITVQFLDSHNGVGIEQFKEYWTPHLTSKDRIYIRPLVNWNGRIDIGSFPSQDEKERFPCTALWTTVSIDRFGNVYPCCESFASRENSDLLFGNINDGSLIDIYDDWSYGIRKKHLWGEWLDIPTCQKCDMWKESPDVWIKLCDKWY